MSVSLRIVYRNSIMADGAPTIEFRRSDTNKKVSCVDCASFTDDGKCERAISHPWPLGSVCCTEWIMRAEPHATKACLGCGREIPKYLHNQDYCDGFCRVVHGGPDPMKGLVKKSSHTPGLKNAVDVCLGPGTRIKYECEAGTVGGVIKSEYRKHTNGAYGWEAIFDDTKELGFADELRVVDWDGKVP